MKQIAFNTAADGTARTIKANYWKASLANFIRGGKDSESQPSRVLTIGYVYRSQQNGAVYDPTGVAPCLCVGAHSGVEPRIIVYD